MANVTSIRVGAVHITANGPQDFKTINAAKRHSRALPPGSVRAFIKHPGEVTVKHLLGIKDPEPVAEGETPAPQITLGE